MAQKWVTTINGQDWTIYSGGFHFPPRLAAATTWASHTIFDPSLCPDSISLGHEWHHTQTTNDFLYAISFTIGKLWNDSYWKNEEIAANQYGLAHKNDPIFVTLAAQMRKDIPLSQAPNIDTIDHPVS